MKRIASCWLLLGIVLTAGAAPAATPVPANRPYPHRYQVSSFGVWVRTNAPGHAAYRYTYRGQVNGFQPPAVFTYGGTEHNEQMHGPGQLSGPWH